ncbi:MAG: transglutaminase-like domain-containing protein [Syntrophobacterales bacterium]
MNSTTTEHLIMVRLRRYMYWLLVVLLLLPSGCGWMYFRKAGEPPSPPLRYTLADWPFEEYWTGVVFNGAKIGFTHLSLSPAETAAAHYEIRSEAALRFRFLMFDKKITLKSYDLVAADLSLRSFAYDYDLDGNILKLTGRFSAGNLEVEVSSRGQTTETSIPVNGKLYPTSIIAMYPVLHGLELGRHYSYQVYDGETQSIAMVTQEILAYEESDLFPGKAFKIKTGLHGQKVTTWIGLEGKPQLEIGHGGVIISGLESEVVAKRYLAQASINKEETLLDFSLIKIEAVIQEPQRVSFLEVVLSGIHPDLRVPNDELQQCQRRGEKVICRISTPELSVAGPGHNENPYESLRYLQSTQTVPSQDELIRKTAKHITAASGTPLEKIKVLIDWMQNNIEQEPVDVFTALDVLSRKKAECQGHTYLYAAFARSLGIPTRVVNGIVYSQHYSGFLYHAWAESLIGDHWITVDPTLVQLPADATHIKFVEGESFLDLMPMVDLVGRLQVQIIAVDSP